MVAASVDLGSIKITGRKHNLSLTLSSSCTIVLPSSWSTPYTADELRRASFAGDLWISKAGSCPIEFLTLLNGELPDSANLDPTVTTAIVGLASECSVRYQHPCLAVRGFLTAQIWDDLGLKLRVNHTSHDRLDRCCPQISFFLHHPDLTSEMIAPQDVRVAQFQSLTCEIDYCFGTVPRGKTNASRQPTLEPSSSSLYAPEGSRRSKYSLRSNPRLSRKAAAAHDEMISPPNLEQGSTETFAPEAVVAEMTYLLDLALRKLIGSGRILPKGKTIKSTQPHSLVDIAPAVWNLRYLQVGSHPHLGPFPGSC